MKGDTDLPITEMEKTPPVLSERCNFKSFQSIESKEQGGWEENQKNPHTLVVVTINAGRIATQARYDSKCDSAGSHAPVSDDC